MVLIRPLTPTAVLKGSALPLLFEAAFHVTTNTDLQSGHPHTHTHNIYVARDLQSGRPPPTHPHNIYGFMYCTPVLTM